MYQITHLIQGQSFTTNGRTQDVYNPATGKVIGQVALADKAIIDKAVAAAKAAFPAWSATTPIRRARILFQYKTLVEKHTDELARLITQEHGKTISDARGSIQRGIEVLEYVCGIPALLQGRYAADVATDVDTYSLHQPLGVCAGITPFNFPAMVPLWMYPMAVACGNTFVLKPSEKDPSCPTRLIELAKEAGFPDGVINLVQGDAEAVDAILKHPDISAISFVGSTAIADHVYKTGIAHGKRVQAFGGAKNHCVVMPDADLDQAADALVGAGYGSAGERCMAISVVVAVGDELADNLVAKMIPRIQDLKIGPGTIPNIEIGPLVTQAHWEKVKSYIDLGVEEGAKLVVDGRNYKPQGSESGFFMGGSLFDDVKPNMRIYREEIFGPVLCIMRVPNFDAAVKLVSDHEYGNGTAIFTRDGGTARDYASKVQVGMVGINIPIPVPVAYHSFGGWKHSVFGDIPMHNTDGVRFYTKVKTVTQRWFKDNASQKQFEIPTHGSK